MPLLLFFLLLLFLLLLFTPRKEDAQNSPACRLPRRDRGLRRSLFFLDFFFFVYLFVLIWLFVLPPVISPFPLSGGSNMAGDGLFGGRWRREELSAAPARPARC